MKTTVLNSDGKDTGRKAELMDSVFNIEPNDHAIYLDVKQYMARKRQGTHKTKERSEITGSTRKIKRQKGTGTARAGNIKSPVFVGGGRAFGPAPRDYSFKVNKKVKQLARKSALSYKARDKNIMVVEDFDLDTPKTGQFALIKNNLELNEKKIVLVLSETNRNIYLSSRNIPDTEVITVKELNTYKILNASKLVFFESAVAKMNDNFGDGKQK